MIENEQADLLSPVTDLQLVRMLLAELHDDLPGKVARFRQLTDLSAQLGRYGTMMPGGETVLAAWTEARTSFVHGNYMATVMLCQGLAEHMLAAQLSLGIEDQGLPKRIKFTKTLERCIAKEIVTARDAKDLRQLMELRNPLSHFRDINDPSNLSRRALDRKSSAEQHLLSDASFAIAIAIRLIALPAFRVDG
jgi:hypothetical protein